MKKRSAALYKEEGQLIQPTIKKETWTKYRYLADVLDVKVSTLVEEALSRSYGSLLDEATDLLNQQIQDRDETLRALKIESNTIDNHINSTMVKIEASINDPDRKLLISKVDSILS